MVVLQSCVVLMNYVAYRILSLVSQMDGIYSLSAMWNLVWHRLIKSCFIWHHAVQHCSDTFKLNKHANFITINLHG